TWQGKDPATAPLIAMNSCSHDYPNTSGFVFVEGRDFRRGLASASLALVVNESAAKLFAPKSPLGQKITGNLKHNEIVGVVKDQIRSTPFLKQLPHIYFVNYAPLRCITIKISKGASIRSALSKIESVMKNYDPGAPFEYNFVDADYAKL